MDLETEAGRHPGADPGVVYGYVPERTGATDLALGPGARLRSGTVLYAGSRIGAGLQTGHGVILREDCVVGDDVSIWTNTIVDYGCVLGDRVKIHSLCYVAQYSTIGDDAFLAPGVVLTNDLYPGTVESAEALRGPTIEAGAQIGANTTVLPYVTVGRGAMVGAGSIVTRDVPPRTVAVGSPASVTRPVEALSVAQRIQSLQQRGSAGHGV